MEWLYLFGGCNEKRQADYGTNRGAMQKQGLHISGVRYIRRPSEYVGLRPARVEFKNNLKQAWWKKFIKECQYNVGLDCAILMNPQVWVASGHVGGFSDPLMDCKECRARFRADHLIEDYAARKGLTVNTAAMKQDEMEAFIAEKEINCPVCGKRNFTGIRKFNLMFKTFQGVTEDSSSEIYLRPETAQGIFVNFRNVQRTTRKRIPFGIGQIGKSFRNEITPGNFTFRTREF
jgi:glycyl-tRNA synthetase